MIMKFLIFLVILSQICLSVYSQQGKIIFFYDFNKEQEGKPPSEPWKPTPAGKVEVVGFPSKANKSVRIVDSGSGAGMQLILDKPIKDKTVSLEFKWYREEGDNTGVEIFYVLNQLCPDDWSGVCTKTENGRIAYNSNNVWFDATPFKDKVWYDFKYVMYLDKNEYDFYLNGEQLAKNAIFRKYDAIGKAGIDKFNVANVGNGGSTFTVYFDDIILYEGTIRPLAVESKLKMPTFWGTVKSSLSENPTVKYPGGHKGTRFEKGMISQSKFH